MRSLKNQGFPSGEDCSGSSAVKGGCRRRIVSPMARRVTEAAPHTANSFFVVFFIKHSLEEMAWQTKDTVEKLNQDPCWIQHNTTHEISAVTNFSIFNTVSNFLQDIKEKQFSSEFEWSAVGKKPPPFWIQHHNATLENTTRASAFALPCRPKFAKIATIYRTSIICNNICYVMWTWIWNNVYLE